MHEGTGGENDEPTLSEAFWGLARQLRQFSRDFLAPWDISPSHARALMVLARHGDMRPGELSEHLHIAARSGTEVVDALEDRGLVHREPDPHDRRATLVRLTDEGNRLAGTIRNARTADADAYFARLSATDRAHLARILRKLRAE